MSKISSSEQFNSDGVLEKYNSSAISGSEEEGNIGKSSSTTGREDEGESGDSDSSSSEFGFDEEDYMTESGLPNSGNKKEDQRKLPKTDVGNLDDVSLRIFSPRTQEEKTKVANILDEESLLSEFKKLCLPLDTIFPSIGILKKFESGFSRCLSGEEIRLPSYYSKAAGGPQKLSTGEILLVAGENFIRSSSLNMEDISMLSRRHPIVCSLDALSEDEKRDVELVENLLASADKIGHQKYKPARTILRRCDAVSSKTGNPVKRLVYYFSEALREKINRETGEKITSKNGFHRKNQSLENEETEIIHNSICVALDEQLPHCRICVYTAMQGLIENVCEAKKVHVVDLEIRSGLQYTILMQALTATQSPIEHLKITAVGTKFKETIEKTGEWLKSFAKTMNLPFSFNVVMVSDIIDLKLDHFGAEDDETVAIYSAFALRTIIGAPDRLESLMRVLRSLNPCIMVLIEVEVNHMSPVFVRRFTESLFFFGAYFDCMEECMNPECLHRMLAESVYFGFGIKHLIANEGAERKIRHVTISVWRLFFARFWMVEQKLSQASLHQASLMLNKFSSWSSCSLVMDKKSLVIGWKGTPQISVSAWKFVKIQ